MGQTAGLKRITRHLQEGQICILDGAVGTELERRGYQTFLPLWTANAIYDCPDLLRTVHLEYIEAGADIITANTFRTSGYTLAKAGKHSEAYAYTSRAVEIAREAVAESATGVAVAGSVAPLEDCYTPELVPNKSVIEKTYAEQLEALADLNPDLILFETMINRTEIEVVTRLLSQFELPFIMSFTVENGKLLDDTPLDSVLPGVIECGPLALLLNCRTPQVITENLGFLSRYDVPFGAYGNGSGEPGGPTGWCWDHSEQSDREYVAEAKLWLAEGAQVLGGCCGTSPSTVRGLSALRG